MKFFKNLYNTLNGENKTDGNMEQRIDKNMEQRIVKNMEQRIDKNLEQLKNEKPSRGYDEYHNQSCKQLGDYIRQNLVLVNSEGKRFINKYTHMSNKDIPEKFKPALFQLADIADMLNEPTSSVKEERDNFGLISSYNAYLFFMAKECGTSFGEYKSLSDKKPTL